MKQKGTTTLTVPSGSVARKEDEALVNTSIEKNRARGSIFADIMVQKYIILLSYFSK
jgi:hypothetical protein